MSTTTPTPEPRYPVWLGLTSFGWAVLGWILAAAAPRLAFLPGVELLHLLLPGVTVLLILGNLAFALFALFRRKVPVDRLLLVTGLQIGLFTTLFFQFAAHVGADCYRIQQPTHSWEWVQFSLAHALRAADVLDVIEAYGWNIQVIKHRSVFVAAFVVAYHLVIDLFMLGLFWALLNRVKKRLLQHPERAAFVQITGSIVFLAWLGAWLACALWLRPWRAIDIPLWLVENFVRVVDFADAMDSFDIHWHQVPMELPESTLTFLCRIWIALGISFLLNWWKGRAKVSPPVVEEEVPSLWSIPRLSVAAILLAALVVADSVVQAANPERVAELTAVARGDDQGRAEQALAALRRLGPNARDAIVPLAEAHARFPDRRVLLLETLGHLGPDAVDPLRDIVLKGDASEAEVAVASLRRIGPKTAPILAAVWGESQQERVKAAADAALREFGLEAMPFLIEATDPTNSAVHFHWFNELDRNWTLRGTDNRTVLALKKWQVANPLVTNGKDDAWIQESGTAALPLLVKALKDEDRAVRVLAARQLGKFGPNAGGAVAELSDALLDGDQEVRLAATEALGKLGPEAVRELVKRVGGADKAARVAAAEALGRLGARAKEAVPDLAVHSGDADGHVRLAVLAALERIDVRWAAHPQIARAVPVLVKRLDSGNPKVRGWVAETLGKIGPTARDAVPALVRRLGDADETVAHAATVALGNIGPAAKDAVPALVKRLGVVDPASPGNPDWHSRQAAAVALGKIGPAAQAAVPQLLGRLDDAAWQVRVALIETLGKIGAGANAAIPELVKRHCDADPRVRGAAAESLPVINRAWVSHPHIDTTFPDLVRWLADADSQIRLSAVSVLGKIGPAAKGVLLELAGRLAEPHSHGAVLVALSAIDPNWRTHPQIGTVVPVLARGIDAEDSVERRVAVASLAELGSAAAEAVPQLVTQLADPEGRLGAAAALERVYPQWKTHPQIGRAALRLAKVATLTSGQESMTRYLAKGLVLQLGGLAVPELLTSLGHSDAKVRDRTAVLLGQLGPAAKACIPEMAKRLGDDDWGVRRAASVAIGQIDPMWAAHPQIATAVPALVKQLAHAEKIVRCDAAATLAEIGPTARDAIPALTKLLNDSDRLVQFNAEVALRKIRGK